MPAKKHSQHPHLTGEKPEVISTGVFRLVRNPIYTGAILFYLLKEAFGNDYLEYKKKTGMLIPKLRSH